MGNEHTKSTPTLKERGFYDKAAWKKARRAALQRDNYMCRGCLRNGRLKPAQEVHHIKPTGSYPELALEQSNLESLCRQCHEATKPRGDPRGAEQREYPVRIIKA